jgi:putative membrane protein
MRRIVAHRRTMKTAFGVSALFLASYLTYHAVLAIAVLPMVLRTLYLASRRRFLDHRRIARWTLPVWLYVSVTGVIVYFMLYRFAP